MRRALLLVLCVTACDSSPSTGDIKHVPAVPVADAGPASEDGGADASDDVDAGLTFAQLCQLLGCPVDLCEPVDGGGLCGVVPSASCSHDGLCAESVTPTDAGWVAAYCTPSVNGLSWSTSPSCDDPANLCVSGAACQAGMCTGGTTTSCTVDACHGACAPSTGRCAINAGASCDDDNACTTGDTCSSNGTCAGEATGTPIHRYSDAADCEWYYGGNPGGGWTDEGVVFRAAPGGDTDVAQLFDNQSLGRPLTTDPSAWSSVGGFTVTEADVVTAFGSSKPGTEKLIRYRFVAGSSCAVSGWARYFSTLNAAEAPAGSSESNTPPGVSTVDTDIWVCPP
jgi:hypothetical protein